MNALKSVARTQRVNMSSFHTHKGLGRDTHLSVDEITCGKGEEGQHSATQKNK